MPKPVATAEDLLDKVPRIFKRFLPVLLLVRIYDCGQKTYSPHPFRFAVVVKSIHGRAEIKSMVYSSVRMRDVRAIAEAIIPFGIHTAWWEHDGMIAELNLDRFKVKDV